MSTGTARCRAGPGRAGPLVIYTCKDLESKTSTERLLQLQNFVFQESRSNFPRRHQLVLAPHVQGPPAVSGPAWLHPSQAFQSFQSLDIVAKIWHASSTPTPSAATFALRLKVRFFCKNLSTNAYENRRGKQFQLGSCIALYT
jgi:hypothetical protein